jgi:hypothetical protein
LSEQPDVDALEEKLLPDGEIDEHLLLDRQGVRSRTRLSRHCPRAFPTEVRLSITRGPNSLSVVLRASKPCRR